MQIAEGSANSIDEPSCWQRTRCDFEKSSCWRHPSRTLHRTGFRAHHCKVLWEREGRSRSPQTSRPQEEESTSFGRLLREAQSALEAAVGDSVFALVQGDPERRRARDATTNLLLAHIMFRRRPCAQQTEVGRDETDHPCELDLGWWREQKCDHQVWIPIEAPDIKPQPPHAAPERDVLSREVLEVTERSRTTLQ